ncbi:polyprotein [Plasmopara halstedii]|uniref:Polyprotein n=1 Tax=Plasmopara halstedii TaxID=4781 RepID=A0A0P1AXN7_PLAHL|nr:polyprotein [Plasmopara halstedii]CEG47201.1 polyprotein [Plasmopara halstedii]|eukprot:XP_024583570.1 polyprotein [Plasmopara halstedii]
MEKARSMLQNKSVSTEWWVEAVNTAVYLISRSSNTAHPDTTPYELAFKTKPQMNHLRVFGSHGYTQEPKSFKCTFLGYAENVKGYRVFGLVKVTRSVKLDELEVSGIYDTREVKPIRIIQVMKDGDEGKVQHQVDRQPVLNNQMEAVEEN